MNQAVRAKRGQRNEIVLCRLLLGAAALQRHCKNVSTYSRLVSTLNGSTHTGKWKKLKRAIGSSFCTNGRAPRHAAKIKANISLDADFETIRRVPVMAPRKSE
jgi:hypothetical protein